jgi:hypothetical protein
MKILFLDIDGVLNYEQYYTRGRRDAPHPLSEICPVAIDNLNRIVSETGCKVVISSTWRHSGIQYCINVLRECGFTGMVIGITPSLDKHGEWVCRGNEIDQYLKFHKLYKYDSYYITDHDYAIIDDDSDMLYRQRHNFFECSPVKGLTLEIADKIIQFLNNTQ